MNDPRFAIDPSTRPILPNASRRLAFLMLGVLAALLRVLTAPRRWLARRRVVVDRVLVVEPYGMGDIVALQPLVHAWCLDGRHVIVGAKAEWHAILTPHPNLTCIDLRPPWAETDEQLKYRGLWNRRRGIPAQVATLRPWASGVRGIDVRGDVRSIILLYLAGCAHVETLTHYFVANDCGVFPWAARRLPVDRTVERWRLNSVFARDERLALGPPNLDHLLPHDVARPAAPTGRVGLVPLTPWAGKRWQPEAWRQTLHALRQRGLRPAILCGPGESTSARAAVGDTGIEVDEAADVRGWVRALLRCDAVLCVNTGPMHLAAALDIPLVVIDGSSRLPLWAPPTRLARVLHHQDRPGCAPCHQAGDPSECARRCMAQVRPEEVIAALDSVCQPAHAGGRLASAAASTPRSPRAGFTLAETLLAVALFGLVMVPAMVALHRMVRHEELLEWTLHADLEAREALNLKLWERTHDRPATALEIRRSAEGAFRTVVRHIPDGAGQPPAVQIETTSGSIPDRPGRTLRVSLPPPSPAGPEPAS